METVAGVVERFLFQNQENGYAVFVLSIKKDVSVVVCGYTPALQLGEQVEVQGAWSMHPKFGKQFEAESCKVQLPTSIVGLQKYLGSGLIKGIGPTYAKKLVHYFGTSVLQVIDKEPERLKEVPGVGAKRADMIAEAWKGQKDIADIMVFLQEKGASSTYAAKIYKKYGHNSIAYLTENPYRIAQEIWGIGFKIADQIAQNLGFDRTSVKRIKAGILYALSKHITSGSIYSSVTDIKTLTLELLELTTDDVEAALTAALHDLYNEEKIKLISTQDKHFVCLTQYYIAEKKSAEKLKTLLATPALRTFDTKAVYEKLRAPAPGDIELNEHQQTGIMSCLSNKVSIITGGPGTGKTTLIRQLIKTLDANHRAYRLTAPTGRAAKRMTESTGKYAVTLHRLLEFNVQTMGFTYNEQNALKVDYLIVDESSMIDTFLAYALLKALPLTAHVIFIGDIDQLPPVGAGNFLHDCIKSGIIPTTKLNFIFRQAQNSLIAYNAHQINKGEFPSSSAPDTFKDYYFIKEDNPEMLPVHIKKIMHVSLGRMGLKPEQSVILSPMNRGLAGTQHLNTIMQDLRNPGTTTPHLKRMFSTLKVHDPVMQMRNNYDKHVFNGDIGTIKEIDHEAKTITIAFPEKDVVYDFVELDELVLAYAISIHKSQGSEFDAVIIPLFMQHFTLLQRNLVYTALTRAKKLCILIGQPRAIAMAIKNTKGNERITFLAEFLTSDLTCR